MGGAVQSSGSERGAGAGACRGHWADVRGRPEQRERTGPPAQAQVGDIGLMGGPAKLDGKAVEGVRIFLGGTIGEGAALAAEFEKGIACKESVLLPKLRELLIERFGATPKAGVLAGAA